MADTLSRPSIDIEIRPDGTVRFHVTGAPGKQCEQIEQILLQILQSEVLEREHTPEFYQSEGLVSRLRSLLGRG